MILWILLLNFVVVVSLDIIYVQVQVGDCCFVLVEVWLVVYVCEFGEEFVVFGIYCGVELLGICYLLLFVYFMDWFNVFQVLVGDFVMIDDGIGIVYMVLVYGEDDMVVVEVVGIVLVILVDFKGCFDVIVVDY